MSKPLEIATSAKRPIGDEPLEVEHLVDKDARRITVNDHQRFRETLDDPHKDDADLEDFLTELRTIKKNHHHE